MLLLLLLIQCKISLYLGPVRPVRCFVTPDSRMRFFYSRESGIRKCHSRDSRAPGNGVYCSII